MQVRRDKQLEKERKLNMVEFSMNKNSLKQLGIFDKQGMDQFYKPQPTDNNALDL